MDLKLTTNLAIDPVCGMSVDPAAARGQHTHEGETYYFCSTSCLSKFQNAPAKYLAGHREEMHASPGQPKLETRNSKLETLYICPMCPGVESDRPGACPKCGMALEPAMPDQEQAADPELAGMSRRLMIGLGLGIPLLAIAMLDMLPSRPITKVFGMSGAMIVQWLLATPIVFWCGWPFFVRGWNSLRTRSTNMFTLIALGVGTAYLYSVAAVLDHLTGLHFFPAGFAGHGGMVEPYFESAAAIVVLVLVGQVLELLARRKTGDALRALLQLAPRTARLVGPDGSEHDVPVELLQSGDRVRIRPGEKLPVDGVLVEGSTHVDESMLSGEPIPVAKARGDVVSAGTLNGQGTILVETKRAGDNTLLAQIVRLVGEAQRSRMPVQALVDRVSAWFVPAVLAASLATFVIWAILGASGQRFSYGILNAIAVLIVACPCALGLATPMAVIVGMGRGASLGVLFRNADALERLSKIDTLVFDKTGTLTIGRPEVTAVESVERIAENEMLRLAASLERGSEHPLGSSIVRAAEKKQLPLASANEVQTLAGKGIRGTVEGRTVLVGNTAFLAENGVQGEASRRRLEELREIGNTVIEVAVDGRFAGLLAISDPLRPAASQTIRDLQADGIRLVMLTGDSRTTAQAVARQIGISEIIAEVLPTEKHATIQKLRAEGRIVGMAGDGINDAPALAAADVGIAMGSGTDVAIASADVALIHSDLRALLRARRLSQATMSTIRLNLLLAFVYNVLAIPVAAGILVPLGGGLIGPIWAAAAMSFSSLSVVANSLRLRKAG
jgi:P-type Cu+ transporter